MQAYTDHASSPTARARASGRGAGLRSSSPNSMQVFAEGWNSVQGRSVEQVEAALGPTMMHVTEGAVIGDSAALATSAMLGASGRGASRRACSVITTSPCQLLKIDHRGEH